MMSDKPLIVAEPRSHDNDATITFAGIPGQSAWLTVDPGDGEPLFAVRIARTDEGLAVDVYPDGGEDGEPIGSTWVLYGEARAPEPV